MAVATVLSRGLYFSEDEREELRMASAHDLDVGLLRTFVTVVGLGNFTAADERLGLSQSAVSQSIQKLESEINRHVLSKSPELSAVAICKVSELCDTSRSFGPFLVFHTKDPNMPSVPKHAFPDSSSIWLFEHNDAT